MIPEDWLKSLMVLPGATATSVEALTRQVAEIMATAAGTDWQRIEGAFAEALRGEGFSLGRGVAIPHTELEHLSETVVCLATLPQPLTLGTIDGRPPDIFLFILSKPDPHAHLLLLAHLARLTQSRTLLEGLRRARTPEEAVQLVRAAEMRHKRTQGRPSLPPATTHALFIISIGGEKAVDALLIDLVDLGFGDASVLEAQSLQEVAAREVPLFAGFQDLFGDPGGRRILILEAKSDRVDAVIQAVKAVSEEHKARDARVSVVPLHTQWILPASADEKAPGAH